MRPSPGGDEPSAKHRLSTSAQEKKPLKKRLGTEPPSKQLVLSRRSTILWGLFLCVFMVWIFTLGVLVGRGFMFQNEKLKKLEERMGQLATGDVPAVTVEEGSKESAASQPALTFYKSLVEGRFKTDLETIKKRKPASPPVQPQMRSSNRAISKASPGPSPKKASARASSPPPEPTVKPEVQTVPQGISQALPPERDRGENFTIQVAAVGDLDQARKFVNQLREKGYPAYFYHVQHQTRLYFRIRVGHYKDRAEAEAVLARLREFGRQDMFISRLVD